MAKQFMNFILILYWLSIVYGQQTYSIIKGGVATYDNNDVNNYNNNHKNNKQNMPISNYLAHTNEMNTNTLFNGDADVHRDRDILLNILDDNSNHIHNEHNSDNDNKEYHGKRVERYTFGLGHQAFTYANDGSGKKRFPVYNFGLGKRARPYSFGMGKRSSYDYEDKMALNDLDLNLDNALETAALLLANEKRSRPYSFGLGKRYSTNSPLNGPMRFNFGLGH